MGGVKDSKSFQSQNCAEVVKNIWDFVELEGGEGGGGHGKVVGCVGLIAKAAEKAVSELTPNLIS